MNVLKVIRIQENTNWNYFAGNLYYTRKFTKNYKAENSDYIDEMILTSIKKVFPDSHLVVNKDILFENQLEELLNAYSGKNDVDFKMSFVPSIPYDKIFEINDMEIYSYTFQFNFNRISLFDDDKLKYVNTHMQAEIPFDKIEDFNYKIKTIEFKK